MSVEDTFYVTRNSPTGIGSQLVTLASLGHGEYILESGSIQVNEAYAIPAVFYLVRTDSNEVLNYQAIENGWTMTGTYHALRLSRPIRVMGPLIVMSETLHSASGYHIGKLSYRRIINDFR